MYTVISAKKNLNGNHEWKTLIFIYFFYFSQVEIKKNKKKRKKHFVLHTQTVDHTP